MCLGSSIFPTGPVGLGRLLDLVGVVSVIIWSLADEAIESSTLQQRRRVRVKDLQMT